MRIITIVIMMISFITCTSVNIIKSIGKRVSVNISVMLSICIHVLSERGQVYTHNYTRMK